MLKCELDIMEYVATVEDEYFESLEEEDFEDEDEYIDDYDECGYNPYMGCYDYDC